jgi:hypothetical protein
MIAAGKVNNELRTMIDHQPIQPLRAEKFANQIENAQTAAMNSGNGSTWPKPLWAIRSVAAKAYPNITMIATSEIQKKTAARLLRNRSAKLPINPPKVATT